MPEPLRVLLGSLGPGVLPSARDPLPAGTVLLDLGADHPSRAGLVELALWTDDGVVTAADVAVGAMHRGAEKLFEVRDYRQVLMLADRHDWQSPFTGELGIALAAEELLGLEVPPRAVWLRTLLAEHSRIAGHLGFLGYLARRLDVPVPTVLREHFREQLSALTGNRVHPMVSVIGGLAVDATDTWLAREVALLPAVSELSDRLQRGLDTHPFARRLTGLAPLSAGTGAAYGVTGPAARAAGAALDLRRSDPYLAYAELGDVLDARPGARTDGDARSRFGWLVAELSGSALLVRACAERLAAVPGPVDVPLPKILRVPEGETERVTEAPLGWSGCWLVSRGEKTPWRLKLRTPSFNHVSALPAVLPGCGVDDLEPALASIGYVVGDIDK